MSAVDVILLMESGMCGTMLIVLWFWLFRDAFRDHAQLKLRAIRHDMFVQAAEGKLEFANPKYAEADRFIGAASSLLSVLSAWHLVYALTHHRQRKADRVATTLDAYEHFEMSATGVVVNCVVRRSLFLSAIRFILKRVAPDKQRSYQDSFFENAFVSRVKTNQV